MTMKIDTIGRIVRNQPTGSHVYVRKDVLDALKKLYPADDFRRVHKVSESDLESGLSMCDVEVISEKKHELYWVLDEAVLQSEKALPGYFRFLASLVSLKNGREVSAFVECINSRDFVRTCHYLGSLVKTTPSSVASACLPR